MTNLDPQATAEKASKSLQSRDACAALLGIEIDHVEPGAATVSMTVAATMSNGHGTCQGGILATLADTAFAHAANSYNRVTVGQGISIDFLQPAMLGEKLIARASEHHRGRTTGLYEVRIHNADNKLLAVFSGRSFELDQSVFDQLEDPTEESHT